jgi:hypothetical protein
MPFEKGKNPVRKASAALSKKPLLFGNRSDPWSVVLKVRLWAAELRDGKVHSCAEVARREGITRARVSQLWPLSEITKEQADEALTKSRGTGISLRRLIRIARNPDLKCEGPGAENMASG